MCIRASSGFCVQKWSLQPPEIFFFQPLAYTPMIKVLFGPYRTSFGLGLLSRKDSEQLFKMVDLLWGIIAQWAGFIILDVTVLLWVFFFNEE